MSKDKLTRQQALRRATFRNKLHDEKITSEERDRRIHEHMSQVKKPRWGKYSPRWANWLAQNSKGFWVWFENKPTLSDEKWIKNKGRKKVACLAIVRDPWEKSLEPRPAQYADKEDDKSKYHVIDVREQSNKKVLYSLIVSPDGVNLAQTFNREDADLIVKALNRLDEEYP